MNRAKKEGVCGECGHSWSDHDSEGCHVDVPCSCMRWPYHVIGLTYSLATNPGRLDSGDMATGFDGIEYEPVSTF